MSVTELINADSTSIVITRHTKVPNAGGFDWTPTVLPAQTVRLYQFSTRNQREFTLPEGEVKQVVLGVLAQPTGDFVFGHDSYDTFVYDGRTYRIVGVRDYDAIDIPNCLQCDCVAV